MEVLIVAKTHMSQTACVGGFELSTHKNIRLLNEDGSNQPTNTPFEVGQVWDVEYDTRPNLKSPHMEDVLIRSQRFIRNQLSVGQFLIVNAPVWRGSPETLFDGKIHYERAKSGYVRPGNVPLQSVGFWLSDKNLELTILNDHKHYFYFGDGNEVFVIPYVGYANPIDTIRSGILVRVSLARWWRQPGFNDERCYLQISGWYS